MGDADPHRRRLHQRLGGRHGHIVGDTLADGGVAYLIAVPEPATMTLLGVSILGLVLVDGRSRGRPCNEARTVCRADPRP